MIKHVKDLNLISDWQGFIIKDLKLKYSTRQNFQHWLQPLWVKAESFKMKFRKRIE